MHFTSIQLCKPQAKETTAGVMAPDRTNHSSESDRDHTLGPPRESPSKNVFKRLSTSPVKIGATNAINLPQRASPVRPKSNWEAPLPYHTTPRRLQSPPSLQGLKAENGTLSVDRAQFRNASMDGTIRLSFPTSPVKSTYSNTATAGGDGSLSRIRARFSTGQRSPQKPISQDQFTQKLHRNLLPQLQEEVDEAPKSEPADATKDANFPKSTKKNESPRHGFQVRKPKALTKKSVKFETIEGSNDNIESRLSELELLLTRVLRRQDRLEAKLDSIQHARTRSQ